MSKWKRRRNDKVFQLGVMVKNARRRQRNAGTNGDVMYWMGMAHGLEQAQEVLMGHYSSLQEPEEIGPDLLSKRKPRKA